MLDFERYSDSNILSEFWYKYSKSDNKVEIVDSEEKIDPIINAFESNKSRPTSQVVVLDKKVNQGGGCDSSSTSEDEARGGFKKGIRTQAAKNLSNLEKRNAKESKKSKTFENRRNFDLKKETKKSAKKTLNGETEDRFVLPQLKKPKKGVKKEYSVHRTKQGNLVLEVKIKNRNHHQNPSRATHRAKTHKKRPKKWIENVTVLDKYIDQYLISDNFAPPQPPQTTQDHPPIPSNNCQSHFVVINRLGRINYKFGWKARVKMKFRIKKENGDVHPSIFIMKFDGGNFGVLKLNKNVLIKKFRITEYDGVQDFSFRKRITFVMGYQSPEHGLLLFLKLKKTEDGQKEVLRMHQIRDLSRMYERDFEEDSGVSHRFLDHSQFQVIEFCFDRVLVHIYDQLLIYDITKGFELQLVKNVRHFGSGFCGSAFFYSREVIIMAFSRYICKYYIKENRMERKEISKSLGKFLATF